MSRGRRRPSAAADAVGPRADALRPGAFLTDLGGVDAAGTSSPTRRRRPPSRARRCSPPASSFQ
jgi:hypothetical protein